MAYTDALLLSVIVWHQDSFIVHKFDITIGKLWVWTQSKAPVVSLSKKLYPIA